MPRKPMSYKSGYKSNHMMRQTKYTGKPYKGGKKAMPKRKK